MIFGTKPLWPPQDTYWSVMPQNEDISREEIIKKWRERTRQEAEEEKRKRYKKKA